MVRRIRRALAARNVKFQEHEGVWYRWADNGEGWLCPALFLYFPEAPTRLYAKAEAL